MAAPDRLIILGFGGHARSVADIAIAAGYRELVFVDENARPGEGFAGFPAVTTLSELPDNGWVWISAIGDNARRAAAAPPPLLAETPQATLIAPSAHIGLDATLGAGSVVGFGAHVGPGAAIGSGVIINTGAIVEHECTIGPFAHISVAAAVAGRSAVGARSFIGAGATVIDGVSVGADITIGAGGCVVCSLDAPGIYVGVPVKLLTKR